MKKNIVRKLHKEIKSLVNRHSSLEKIITSLKNNFDTYQRTSNLKKLKLQIKDSILLKRSRLKSLINNAKL